MTGKKKKSRGKLGWFLSGAPLKMQEDCYSTQMWLLFPACIRCLGNTKLIVTARRELSVLKQASLRSLPPSLLLSTPVTPVLSLADTLFDFHLFVCVTRHPCQQLFCDTLTFLASFPFSPMSLSSSHVCCTSIYFSHFPSPLLTLLAFLVNILLTCKLSYHFFKHFKVKLFLEVFWRRLKVLTVSHRRHHFCQTSYHDSSDGLLLSPPGICWEKCRQ